MHVADSREYRKVGTYGLSAKEDFLERFLKLCGAGHHSAFLDVSVQIVRGYAVLGGVKSLLADAVLLKSRRIILLEICDADDPHQNIADAEGKLASLKRSIEDRVGPRKDSEFEYRVLVTNEECVVGDNTTTSSNVVLFRDIDNCARSLRTGWVQWCLEMIFPFWPVLMRGHHRVKNALGELSRDKRHFPHPFIWAGLIHLARFGYYVWQWILSFRRRHKPKPVYLC